MYQGSRFSRIFVSAMALAVALHLSSCSQQEPSSEVPIVDKTVLGSGIDMENFDQSVSPGDDFYRYVNGKWLDRTQIPAEKSNYGTFTKLADEAEEQLQAIIQESADADNLPGTDAQKVGDLYASFMNEKLADELGIAPLQPLLDKIRSLESYEGLPQLLALLGRYGVTQPIGAFINQDAKAPDNYTVYLWQYGLGLPDRDYYLDKENQKFIDIRAKYLKHLELMLGYIGEKDAANVAKNIMAFETQLAEVSWTRVENRDDDLTYNKRDLASVNDATPGFDLKTFLSETGVHSIDSIVVSQPSFFEGMAKIFADTPLMTVKSYLQWQAINEFAPYLSSPIVNADFEFYSKTLRGVEENRARWKRGVALVEGGLGEVLGKIYVERHFSPQAKMRMEQLVGRLIQAYEQSITNLEWMSEETKEKALEKLSKFNVKIGYPNKWKDYSSLEIRDDDLLGNVMRSSALEHERELAKLGSPIDRDEWHMTPQTVNAYYNPVGNEIVFPAAILQPPFFHMEAEDAVNYGGIGAVIGHEIGHGFDDQGSKYDGNGKLQNWWTEADRDNFMNRTRNLNDQFNGFCPLEEGQPCVNGELTIGENIGDLGGLSIALKAYHLSLEGTEPPIIDELTGDQRVFMGWAQVWRRLYRDEELLNRLKTDPHSPSKYRTNGIVRNIPEWYTAFGVKEGDALFLPDEERVKIW